MPGAAAAAVIPSTVAALAGRYDHSFPDQLVSGESYTGTDVVEIVPVDATHAYVRFSLDFYNGHSCSLSGVAEAQGDALVYQEPADKALPGEPPCRLAIRRKGRKLTWDDAGSCKADCGARGSFSGGDLPWSSKRRITYLARLERSSDYRSALTEWRTGHAVKP